MNLKTVQPVLWVIASGLVASCGGGGGDSTPAAPPPPANLSQASIDSNTALNITNAVVDIYNQNVAGRSQSAYNNVTVNCPNGGTVRIAGLASLASNTNITTVNLTYTMTNCRETRTTTNFVYSGVMVHTGSFNLATSFVSENIQSSGGVTMVGTISISGFNTANVNQTTTFSINRTSLNDANGNIGGRAFTY